MRQPHRNIALGMLQKLGLPVGENGERSDNQRGADPLQPSQNAPPHWQRHAHARCIKADQALFRGPGRGGGDSRPPGLLDRGEAHGRHERCDVVLWVHGLLPVEGIVTEDEGDDRDGLAEPASSRLGGWGLILEPNPTCDEGYGRAEAASLRFRVRVMAPKVFVLQSLAASSGEARGVASGGLAMSTPTPRRMRGYLPRLMHKKQQSQSKEASAEGLYCRFTYPMSSASIPPRASRGRREAGTPSPDSILI